MEQLSVEETNFRISNFVGWRYDTVENEVFQISYHELHQYHEDWNLLMSVIGKIESLGYRFKQCRRRVVIEYDHQPSIEKDFTVLMVKADTKILAAWQACEKFIEWYQTQNSQP